MPDTARMRPQLIRIQDLPAVRVHPDTAPNTLTARLITNQTTGANMLLGMQTIFPGDDCGWYGNGIPGLRGYGPADYLYFVLSGQLEVLWADIEGNEGSF